MKNYIKNKNGKIIEVPPYKCKVCGQCEIEFPHDICPVCGWEDDVIQNDKPDCVGGANQMSLNQYKKFWEENKEEINKNIAKNRFFAIELSENYFDKNFKD